MPWGPWPGVAGGGTLAKIYAFGLADNASVDNRFSMPGGELLWTGSVDWGPAKTTATVQFFEDRSLINLAEPPSYELISKAANIFGEGGSADGNFRQAALNDTRWDGTFTQINGHTITWILESILFSASVSETDYAATEYGRRYYQSTGIGPYQLPNTGQVGASMFHALALFNDKSGDLEEIEETSGFGQVGRRLFANVNGAVGQWVTHWNNVATVPAAGDGPAWLVDIDGRFAHYDPRAAVQMYQVTASAGGAWGVRLWASDGIVPPVIIADFVGGTFELPSEPTAAVGSAGKGRLRYNDSTANLELSASGGSYSPASRVFMSGAINVLVGGTTRVSPDGPAGTVFVPIRGGMVVDSITGTATGAMVVNFGSNSPNFNNQISANNSFPTVSVWNQGPGGQAQAALTGGPLTQGGMFLNITTPLAGPSVATGKYWVEGYFLPIP